MSLVDFNGIAAAIATIIAVIACVVAIIRDFRRSTEEEVQRSQRRVREEVPPDSIDNLSALLVQNFRVLNLYYSENLSQSRTNTRASFFIAVLGFIAIVAGVVIRL